MEKAFTVLLSSSLVVERRGIMLMILPEGLQVAVGSCISLIDVKTCFSDHRRIHCRIPNSEILYLMFPPSRSKIAIRW